VILSGYPDVVFDFELMAPQTQVLADAALVKQVFTNLFLNSVEAMDSKGQITVRTDLVKKGNTDYCRAQISDTGSGISPENADKVFSPYFTTKKKGTGLGLSFVDRIVVEHRGQIWFESEKEQGTTFYIDLPLGEKDE
jgi:signal transduction histidine kinase